MKPSPVAAIDIGTNSFHMIVCEISDDGFFNIINREKENVRLGASIGDRNKLDKEAIKRGVECLDRFVKIAKTQNAVIKAVATSALRESENRDDFINQVYETTGLNIQLITGNEEGRLIFQGVSHSMPLKDKKILLLDIGGGSSEIVIGKNQKIDFCNSTKLGSVRLTKRFFDKPIVTQQDIKKCKKYIKGVWEPILKQVEDEDCDVCIFTSGTLENLIQVTNKRINGNYVEDLNGFSVSRQEIKKTINNIKEFKNPDEILKIDGIEEKRADIILAGSLITEYFLKAFKPEKSFFSSYALREGIIYEQLHEKSKDRISELRLNTVKNVIKKYELDEKHSWHVHKLCMSFFDGLYKLHKLENSEREILEVAALLHDCGFFISHDAHHLHSSYLIKNTEMPGFTSTEKEVIAQVSRYHRKSLPKSRHNDFNNLTDFHKQVVWILGGILRIVEGLDRRQSGVIEEVSIKANTKFIYVSAFKKPDSNPDVELWGAYRRKEMLEKILDRKIIIKIV